jgi:hypothetical protein
MSCNFGDKVRLGNRKKLQARNYANTNYVDMMEVNANDEIVLNRIARPKRVEFGRIGRPIISTAAVTGGAATGTAGDENLLIWPGCKLEYHILGTQTIVGPVMTSLGLDLGSMDQTANDGWELCPGCETALHDQVFTVGTSPAFYFEAKLKIADVSGTDDLAIGFRKYETYQANVDDYDEMAAINIISGDIKIETILNGAATTTTDTTDNWADAATKTVRVEVSSAGVVTYKIDGQPPTATAAFTFDTGEVVVPFIYVLQDTDIMGACPLIHWECGYQ